MNLYFWIFSLYALLITPVTLHVQVRIGREFRYRLRVQIAGLPFLTKRKQAEEPKAQLKAGAMAKGLFSLDRQLVWQLLREGHMGRLMQAFRLEQTWVYVRIAFADAAWTAMIYAALRTALQSLFICRRSLPIQGRVEMDFQGQDTQLMVRCILSARLGSILKTALRLLAAILRTRAGFLTMEEDTYAAASH